MAQADPTELKLKNGKSVLIRHGVESDAAQLRECVIEYVRDGSGQLWEPGEFAPTVEFEREWIRGMLLDPNELLLVAEREGRIIGNIDFHVGKRKRLAHSGEFGMSCMPAWRGVGLGSLLLGRLLEWARQNPAIEKVNLRVISGNAHGIALYRKHGFVEEGRKRREIRYSDGTYADEVLMGQWVGSAERGLLSLKGKFDLGLDYAQVKKDRE
jgi:RimJ/RimL family protein N-acetyltransferase